MTASPCPRSPMRCSNLERSRRVLQKHFSLPTTLKNGGKYELYELQVVSPNKSINILTPRYNKYQTTTSHACKNFDLGIPSRLKNFFEHLAQHLAWWHSQASLPTSKQCMGWFQSSRRQRYPYRIHWIIDYCWWLSRSGSSGIFFNPRSENRKHDPRFVSIPMPAKDLSEVVSKAGMCALAVGVTKHGEGFGIRCRRENATTVRAQVLPESAFVETASFEADESLYVARNVPQVSRDELTAALRKTGWEANAIKPQGMNRWLLASKDAPPASHLVLNESIVIVEPLHKKSDVVPITFTAREFKVDTTMDPNSQVVSTSTRFAEIRAQVEAQLSQTMDAKLQQANSRIEELSNTLQMVQSQAAASNSKISAEVIQLKEEQQFTRQKITEVESSVAAGNQTLISQMQAMMAKMQTDIIQSIADPDKRQKKEEKHDAFSTKSWLGRHGRRSNNPFRVAWCLVGLLLQGMMMTCAGLQVPKESWNRNLDAHDFSNLKLDTELQSVGMSNLHMHNANLMYNIWDSSTPQFFSSDEFETGSKRVGEAQNPGPWSLRTFNPTQLLGHEEEISKWPQGIFTASETSHTATAQNVIAKRFRKVDMNGIYSHPAEVHTATWGAYRGKAVGTAILSRFPMKPYPVPVDDAVHKSSRFSDAVVTVGQLPMYISVVYGPPPSSWAHENAEKIFLQAMLPALQRALAWKGPAVISGDFNRDLHDCSFWPMLKQLGWVDCAELAWEKFQFLPQPTCKDSTRKSFLLINNALAPHMTQCKTVDHHMFAAHPVLEAVFDHTYAPLTKQVWSLPRSLDEYMFDPELLHENANYVCKQRQAKFQECLQKHDADDAAREFALAFEDTIRMSAVTTDGDAVKVSPSCFGRCQKKVIKTRLITAPVIKKARDSDLNVPLGQVSLSLRRHVTQGRRLQSLCRQLKARDNNPTNANLQQCSLLWAAICHASGFEGSFQKWILDNTGMFVPTQLPDCQYIQVLYDEFMHFVQAEVAREKHQQYRQYQKLTLEDIAKGGGMSFQAVRTPSNPPPAFLSQTVEVPVTKQRWRKEGLKVVQCQQARRLQEGIPAQFQEQDVMITKVDTNLVEFDKPVRLRNACNMLITQKQTACLPQQMQTMVSNAWNQYWQAPPVDRAKAAEFVSSLSDCESCPYKEFGLESWNKMMRGVNLRSARGACGFSMKDLAMLPEVLVTWLFQLYEAVEQGMPWPVRFTLARVVMLAKPGEDCHQPTSVRPITILSSIYRLWSRFRSLQVIQHLGHIVPAQIGGVASRLSADCLMAYICDTLESAQESGSHCCGLVLDLKKCFNLVPRAPLISLMQKLNIPDEYIQGHQAMLAGLVRILELNGQVGDGHASTCGIPEGCAFSVASMVALTILAAEAIQKGNASVDVTMFADNWGCKHQTFQHCKQQLTDWKHWFIA